MQMKQEGIDERFDQTDIKVIIIWLFKYFIWG